MKTIIRQRIVGILTVCAAGLSFAASSLPFLLAGCATAVSKEAQQQMGGRSDSRQIVESPEVRVGIYDSRAIALAWAGSEFFDEEFNEWTAKHDKAKAARDDKRVSELQTEARARQVLLHRQGFSTAPVDDILDLIKDRLPEIGERAGVVAIVSKWDEEALASYGSAKQVDITMALVEAFGLNQRQLELVEELRKQPPVPLEELERLMAGEGR